MRIHLGNVLTISVLIAITGFLVLSGCDNTLRGDNIISPRADLRITTLSNNGIVNFLEGASGSTSPTSPLITATLVVSNGVPVQISKFRVDYFLSDGVTPAQIPALEGHVERFIDLERNEPQVGSLDIVNIRNPDTLQDTTVSTVDITVPTANPGSFPRRLLGPDNRFGTDDDVIGPLIGELTIFGEDVNRHTVQDAARFTIILGPIPPAPAAAPSAAAL